MKHKRNIWIMLYCLVLTAFTAYFLLDTFVIARVYAVEGAAASGGKQTEETAGSSQTLSAAPQDQQTDSRQPAPDHLKTTTSRKAKQLKTP